MLNSPGNSCPRSGLRSATGHPQVEPQDFPHLRDVSRQAGSVCHGGSSQVARRRHLTQNWCMPRSQLGRTAPTTSNICTNHNELQQRCAEALFMYKARRPKRSFAMRKPSVCRSKERLLNFAFHPFLHLRESYGSSLQQMQSSLRPHVAS